MLKVDIACNAVAFLGCGVVDTGGAYVNYNGTGAHHIGGDEAG